MIIGNVTVPGRQLKCDRCGYTWVSISRDLPDFCANPECRSREWNGKKQKRKPRRAPKIEMPKPKRMKWDEDTEDTTF